MDQKCLLLLETSYPKYLGTWRLRQSSPPGSTNPEKESESGLGSDTDSNSESDGYECESEDAHIAGVINEDSKFDTALPSDEVEIREGKDFIEISLA